MLEEARDERKRLRSNTGGMKTGRQLAEVESFAQRVIQEESADSNVVVDDSLGSYIISCLQNSDTSIPMDAIPEFDSLVELLQEHCHISQPAAKRTLHQISEALRSESSSQYHSTVRYDNQNHNEAVPISPQAAGSLLPVDLLDDGGPCQQQMPTENPGQRPSAMPLHDDAEAFPPLGSKTPAAAASKKPVSFAKNTPDASGGKSASAEEVMSSLFQTTRSRQSSIDETARPPTERVEQQEQQHQQEFQDYHYATSEWLLSMNTELSQEAAWAASIMAQADVSLAQYIIEATIAQVPICRHFVAGDGCYRADCTFSHDIENHTCLFWLKSRCGNGSQCRFKHGFSDQLVQTVEYPSSEFANNTDSAHYEQPSQQQYQDQPAGNSFANIASHGYDTRHSFANADEFPSIAPQQKALRSVPIPNDLWNVHENRDASVFYIADPMERYAAVQQQTGLVRDDVIDLHFQSLQTFPCVLDEVLDTKLRSNESVWIITGTGHHVGNRTHQKGGGALENAVVTYLKDRYEVRRGRDRSGQGGAILIRQSR